MDSFFNPNSGPMSGHKPMKRISEVEYLDSIEDLYKFGSKQGGIGGYKPVKILPSKRINTDAKWPIVFNAGDIVSIKNLKKPSAYTSADTAAGILASGDIYYTIDAGGTARKISIDAYYEQQIAGLLVPANGSNGSVNLPYKNECGENGIILANGTPAAAGGNYANGVNIPIGLVDGAVYADLAHRWLNYDFEQKAVGITRGGVLALPYISVFGSNSGDVTTVVAAIRSKIDDIHQYLLLTGANQSTVEGYLSAGTYLKPNAYGKFTRWVSGTDDQSLKFGEVINTLDRIPYAYNDIKDTFPGLMIEGTDTAGISKRMYHLISSVMSHASIKPTAWTASKVNLVNLIGTPLETQTAGVSIVFGQAEVAFGTAMKS